MLMRLANAMFKDWQNLAGWASFQMSMVILTIFLIGLGVCVAVFRFVKGVL